MEERLNSVALLGGGAILGSVSTLFLLNLLQSKVGGGGNMHRTGDLLASPFAVVFVSLSSLNRHAVATRADVGTPKAQYFKKHFIDLLESHIDATVLLYDESSEDEILSGNPDFVLDCIDNIDTKVALLAACVCRGLKVLSASGAGARADPTRIQVADLRESTNDLLSIAVTPLVGHRLRKEHGIEGGIPAISLWRNPRRSCFHSRDRMVKKKIHPMIKLCRVLGSASFPLWVHSCNFWANYGFICDHSAC
ncbi:hypothetical protein MLD38_001579 [Melastoma candidum]|uniref:Uncharacterized protein n=1 Tax=Melastoma candidum TaxID=119954 RepID=A0ACB9SEP1_9MYRT|nr:hypothetical protein MLD38_001579 [Melastoma candidum]